MWIYTVAPEWIIHFVFAAGIAGTVAGFFLGIIPFIRQYTLVIRIISIIVLCFGVYLEGGLADYKAWKVQVAELERRVLEAEAKAAKKNVEIQEKVVTKTQTIFRKGDDIIQYIDREVVKKEEVIKFIEHCPIPREILIQHNAAAALNKGVEEAKK